VKIFQVVMRDNSWHVHIPHAGGGVHPSQDRARMVDWACDEARRVAGEVHVRDRAGKIEVVYSYSDADLQGQE
jgi:hypothetical protein